MVWNGNAEAQRQADLAFAKMKASVRKSSQRQAPNKKKPAKNKSKKSRTKQPFVRPAYEEYMKSKRWWSRKQQLFKVREKKCELCGSVTEIHVHHLTYDRLGRERDKDLQILCADCHATEHEDKGYFSKLSQEYFQITGE